MKSRNRDDGSSKHSSHTSDKSLESFQPDVFELAPAHVAYIDRDGYYIKMSRSYEEWHGISRDAVLGRHYSELIPEIFGKDYFSFAEPTLKRALAGDSADFEATIPSRQGSRRVHVTYTPDLTGSGELRGVLVLLADVTALKLAEESARESQERLSFATAAGGMGVWEYDIQEDELFGTKPASTFGASRRSLVRRAWRTWKIGLIRST